MYLNFPRNKNALYQYFTQSYCAAENRSLLINLYEHNSSFILITMHVKILTMRRTNNPRKVFFFPTLKCKVNTCKLQVCIPRYCHIATQTWPFKETIRNRAQETKWPYLGIMVRGLYAYISVFFIWSSHLFLLYNLFVLLSASTLRNIALMAVIGVKNLISLLLFMPYHGFEIQQSQLQTTDTF